MNCKQAGLFLSGATLMLSLPACNGIFEGIYDMPRPRPTTNTGLSLSTKEPARDGSISMPRITPNGIMSICTAKQVTTTPVGAAAPETWDFAVHRYDTKTNGGTVWESQAGSFDALPAPGSVSEEQWTTDEWTTDRITVDMSQMMDGVILYAEDYWNPCLSRWLDVDTSTMPPIYTLSGKIYLLRLNDGTCAALRLVNFMNDAAIKGYMTIDYLYPVE